MRRALLLALAALVAPAAAIAQMTTTAAPITFTEGTTDLVHGPWISAAECDAVTPPTPAGALDFVNLSWALANFPPNGSYQVYASTAQISTETCPTADNPNGNPAYAAGPVGARLGNLTSTNLVPVKFLDLLGAVKTTIPDCTTVSGDTPIYVCVQALDSGQNAVSGAIATGRLMLSRAPPGALPSVSAVPADTGALQISWTAPSGSPPAYDYRISAASTDLCGATLCDPNTHQANDLRTLSYIMDGLTVGATYTVEVFPRSEAGNEGTSKSASAKAVKVANWWDVYHDPPYGGVDSGGCGAGVAGPVALLGVAALLGRLRRRA